MAVFVDEKLKTRITNDSRNRGSWSLEEEKNGSVNSDEIAHGYEQAEEIWVQQHPVEAAARAEGNVDVEILSRVVCATSTKQLSGIPDGGVRAWLQVLGSFMIFFNTWCVALH